MTMPVARLELKAGPDGKPRHFRVVGEFGDLGTLTLEEAKRAVDEWEKASAETVIEPVTWYEKVGS